MQRLKGQISALLSEAEVAPQEDLLLLINSRIKPPVPVESNAVYIRAMYLVSDQVNSYGGRFPQDEQLKLTELIVDSPVLIGHNKEKLPIGRNFKAEVVEKEGKSWVKVWFYWLKDSTGAESLKQNIDHGIYKECSLGFAFELPECSVCQEDIRKCEHMPFRSYLDSSGNTAEAHFNYRKIARVLETSIVYRGATPDTSFSIDLDFFRKQEEKVKGTSRNSKVEFAPSETLIAELSDLILALPGSSSMALSKEEDLSTVALVLSRIKEALVSCRQELTELAVLKGDYHKRIRRMSKAVSASRGNQSLSSWVERLLDSGRLGADDLMCLKKNVEEEFNQVFQREPRSRLAAQSDVDVKRIEDFKTG